MHSSLQFVSVSRACLHEIVLVLYGLAAKRKQLHQLGTPLFHERHTLCLGLDLLLVLSPLLLIVCLLNDVRLMSDAGW